MRSISQGLCDPSLLLLLCPSRHTAAPKDFANNDTNIAALRTCEP